MLVEVSDITCGFKAFRGAAGREIFASLRISDWSFDVELLFLAVKRGYRIREVPVRWVNHVGTKVRVGRAAIDSLVGLARIRWYFASGLYDLRTEISEEVDDWRSPSHAELDVKIKE